MGLDLVAEIVDNKIVIHDTDGKTFDLVPYVKTPDGVQQVFGIDTQLDRIAACINDLAAIPTQTIKQGFTKRLMQTAERASQTVSLAKKAIEVVYAKEVKDQITEAKTQVETEKLSRVSPPTP